MWEQKEKGQSVSKPKIGKSQPVGVERASVLGVCSEILNYSKKKDSIQIPVIQKARTSHMSLIDKAGERFNLLLGARTHWLLTALCGAETGM